MKGSTLYIIIIVALTVLVFLSELAVPKNFDWTPTYDKNDREPFGSYVFDDILSSSIDDYQVVNKTFFQIWEEDSTAAPKAFLLTENYFPFSKTDINCLFKLLNSGNQIMICTDRYSQNLKDTIKIDIENTKYYNSVKHYLEQGEKQKDSLFLRKVADTETCMYEVYPFVHTSTVKIDKTVKKNLIRTIVRDKKERILAVRHSVGKGELFIVSTPLMFTNFGILDKQNASYVFGLLSYMKGKPLVRIEAYGDHDVKPSTPLRYLLITPPLKWAVYTTILLILLFMIFTAKRRQRIIPVTETPPNRTLGFIRLISSLFYSRHDNAEILKTKYSVFCSDIKQKTGVDLFEDKQDDSQFVRLAEKTGMPEDEIRQLVKEFRVIPYQYDMPDIQMKELMDRMNRIKRNIE